MALIIPAENVSARTRRVDVRRMLVTLVRGLWTVLLAVPYVAGWTARKVCLGVVALATGVTMLGTAAAVGWREAGPG